MNVEGQIFDNIDLFQIVGYAKAFTIVVPKVVDDGFANISMTSITNKAKLSGIEIRLNVVHTAHAVSGGPVRRPPVNALVCCGGAEPCLTTSSNIYIVSSILL
jgi:hypothetical protein